jgi:hypothetical protein
LAIAFRSERRAIGVEAFPRGRLLDSVTRSRGALLFRSRST